MKKQILAIDDEQTIRMILEATIKKTNRYEVISKADGADAYQWLMKGNFPDLIICDIMMEKMSGMEFLEIIRNSGFFGDIPIIMLSGENESKLRIQCYQKGAQDFLVKPFNPDELIALVDKNLNSPIRPPVEQMAASERIKFYRLGALDFIQHPFDEKEAEEKIKSKITEYKL